MSAPATTTCSLHNFRSVRRRYNKDNFVDILSLRMLSDICNRNCAAEADRHKVDLILARLFLCLFDNGFKIIDYIIHITE